MPDQVKGLIHIKKPIDSKSREHVVIIGGGFAGLYAAQLLGGNSLRVTLFSWLAVKAKMADLPENITWRQIYGVSCLAGIGFTMSLFIATLGFGESMNLTYSKIGILTASLISGVAGGLLLFGTKPTESQNP